VSNISVIFMTQNIFANNKKSLKISAKKKRKMTSSDLQSYRKLKIVQQEPHQKPEMNTGDPEG